MARQFLIRESATHTKVRSCLINSLQEVNTINPFPICVDTSIPFITGIDKVKYVRITSINEKGTKLYNIKHIIFFKRNIQLLLSAGRRRQLLFILALTQEILRNIGYYSKQTNSCRS